MRFLPMLRGYWQWRDRIRFGDEAAAARRFPGAKLQVCRAAWPRVRVGLGRWQVGKPLAIQRWHNVWIPFDRQGPSIQQEQPRQFRIRLEACPNGRPRTKSARFRLCSPTDERRRDFSGEVFLLT